VGLRWAAVRVLLALIAATGVLARRSAAEGLSGYLELNYSNTETKSTDASGQSLESKTDSLTQRYSINLDKGIYQNLNFLAGGFFERQDSALKAETNEVDSTKTSIRPFATLRLRTPLYGAEAGYFRDEEKLKASGLSTAPTIRETYSTSAYWRPDGFPDVKVEYFRANSFDRDRRIQDTTEDRYGVTTNYRPVSPLDLRYQGFFDERADHLTGATVDDTSHNMRVVYSDAWWKRRISVDSDYNLVRNETDTHATGAGEVNFQLFPFAGLSGITDTPETIALDPNLLLIDGNLAAGTGINLGLPPLGGDARPRNLGLDFGAVTEVNALLVTVDRDVTQVAGAFSWRIYTSSDNLNWALRQTVSPAVFSSLFPRFEIRFANVTARYVKLVVAPLSPAVPFASGFPTVLVTELQAELRRPATEVEGKLTRTAHRYLLNIRTRILETPSLAHEFSYFLRKMDPSPFPAEYTVSNGLAFQHQFTKVFSGRARVSREDGQERAGSRSAYLYSASIAAVPLETLSHTLVYSGADETLAGNTTVSNSVFLVNNAKLYEGVDLSLAGGATFTKSGTGQKTDQTQVNGSATLVPNKVVTLNLVYTGSTSTSKGGELPGEKETSNRSWEANVTVTPLPTLYLYGSHRVDRRSAGGVRDMNTTRNYVFNFSPFPYGTLHLNVSYNETVRLEDDSRQRILSPSLRWNMTPGSYLDFTYLKVENNSPVLSDETRTLSGTVRMNF
jgi:hypothetical protein